MIKLNVALKISRHQSLEELACMLLNNPLCLTKPSYKDLEDFQELLLNFAIQKNSIMIKWLIERGVNFHFKRRDPKLIICTPLEYTVLNCDKESVALILQQEFPPYFNYHNCTTLLLILSVILKEESILKSLTQCKEIRELIDHHASIDLIKSYFLEKACEPFLKISGIESSSFDLFSIYGLKYFNPLHAAIVFERMDNIRVLLANGADPLIAKESLQQLAQSSSLSKRMVARIEEVTPLLTSCESKKINK